MAILAERMRVALAIIAHVQVVVEKLAGQHGGPRRRRQAITYLETLKALSRLMLLACTKEMVIGGGAVSLVSCGSCHLLLAMSCLLYACIFRWFRMTIDVKRVQAWSWTCGRQPSHRDCTRSILGSVPNGG